MRFSIIFFLSLCSSLMLQAQITPLSEPIKKLSSGIEKKFEGRAGSKIALLQFRTTNNNVLPFNAFIRDEMVINYQNSTVFKIIDPFMSEKTATETGWNNTIVSSFPFYEKLGQKFMEKTGFVPDAWLYGLIQDNEETITLTAYLVTTGSTDSKIIEAVTFPSTEQTDRLLGKKVRKRVVQKPKTDTVYVERRIMIEKPEPQQITIDTTDQIVTPDDVIGSLSTADYEQFHFQITEVSFVGQKLYVRFTVTNTSNLEESLYITAHRTRIIDADGTEFLKAEVHLGAASSQYSVSKKLVPQIAMKGELVFNQMPANLIIRLLEIGVQNEKVLFKNLPVSR